MRRGTPESTAKPNATSAAVPGSDTNCTATLSRSWSAVAAPVRAQKAARASYGT